MLKSKNDDAETNSIIEETAKNILTQFEKENINEVEDWEIDQLLDWTNTLSFNE